MIPHRTPFFLPLIYPSLIWKMQGGKKEIFLTFDDGPMDGPTGFVLSELQKASARATFFCIGDNVRKYPEMLKRVEGAGHSIGNHTFNHLNGWKTKTDLYVKNVQQFDQELLHITRKPTTLFRPPYGRITPSQIRALSRFRIIMWDVLTRDFDKDLSPDDCLRNSLKAIRPGSIVVFHDSFKAEKNLVFTLPRLISELAGKGYVFNAIPS
jgi:peptidoglycan-N-acetylglucosamine deacetylase